MATATLPTKSTSELDELIAQARAAHAAIQVEPEALSHAFAAGEALSAAKALCAHGEWTAALAATEIPPSTARLYMQLYRSQDRITAAGCRSIRQARVLLSDVKAKKPPRKRRIVTDDTTTSVRGVGDRYEEGYGDGYRAGQADGFVRGAATKANGKAAKADDGWQPAERDLKWLIGLAHPDHHLDDKTILRATRITAWLNGVLERTRS
jgi:hypothetical protein